MASVFWDTNLFVYLFERDDSFYELLSRLRSGMRKRGDRLVTSALTVGELLVLPEAAGDRALKERYERFLMNPVVTVIPFTVQAAYHFAAIRAGRKLTVPDAIHLACAASAGVDLFVTNDTRLASMSVPGIRFITTPDRLPYGY